MNKRGESHVDWAVSMGIFLVYILSMFMLIQPGIQPFYNEENLVSVIEGKLKSDLNHDILRAPIYLDVTKGACPKGQYIDIELISLGLKLDKSDLKLVYLDLINGREVDSPFSLSGPQGDYHIQFNCPYPLKDTDDPHVFVIYYSAGGSYSSAEAKTEKTGDAKINRLFTAKTVTPGTIEHLTGVNKNELQNLASINCSGLEGYESLKEEWAFPAEKEFALYYVEAEKLPYDVTKAIPICNSGDKTFLSPFDQSNVYAKEWGDWILTPEGTMKPIIYNLRIW